MKNFTLLFFLIITNITYSQNKMDKLFIQAESGNSEAYRLLIDNDGNIIVFGFFETETFIFQNMKIKNYKYDPNLSYNLAYFIAKISTKGKCVWLKPIVGVGLSYQAEICFDKKYNIYITGEFRDSIYFEEKNVLFSNDKDYFDCLVLKFSSDGNFLWGKSIGGEYHDSGFSVTSDIDNNLYVSGVFSSNKLFLNNDEILELKSNTKQNIFIIKFSELGDLKWVNSFYGDKYDFPYKMAFAFNSIFICGYFTSNQLIFNNNIKLNHTPYIPKITEDAFILQLDTSGKVNWAHSINTLNKDIGLEICPLKNSELLIGGTTIGDSVFYDKNYINYNNENGLANYFILKINSDGMLSWSKLVKNKFPNYIYLAANDNNYFLGGFYTNHGTVENDFNYPYYGGSNDFFINKYSFEGNYINGISFGGQTIEGILSMILDGNNNIYFSGQLTDNYTIFCGDTIFNLFKSDLPPPNSLPTAYPAFIAKINEFSTKSILIDKDELELYPNPTADFLYLSGIKSLEKSNYKFLDISGHVITPKTEFKGGKIVFDVSELLPGLYILQVESTVKSYSKKFIVSH